MTMTLIETKTLGTAAAQIEFTSIPQDGTDLLVLVSARSSGTDNAGGAFFLFRLNNLTTNTTARLLRGNGSTAVSDTDTEISGRMGASDHTANTFGNVSFYVPNYTGSANKSVSADSLFENNATFARQELVAGLWSHTAAVTSLNLVAGDGNFVIGTTASLYKITKGSDGIVTTS